MDKPTFDATREALEAELAKWQSIEQRWQEYKLGEQSKGRLGMTKVHWLIDQVVHVETRLSTISNNEERTAVEENPSRLVESLQKVLENQQVLIDFLNADREELRTQIEKEHSAH
jgi:Protein of unknown function, DUF536